ncbi:serine/threonine protein phosphatase [Roseobacter sp. HKCCD9010]|uniref:metallophosphoesterase n=1 Tax=unclassified Roseobacter TaxID=196798 RepID=UPI001492C77D|nr:MULTISPECIES: metallophosphoesterase [unclassified Roseobacter]MBF9048857.1 serine/threonine protein phosphatase [Rhodobacterales bacterium HKCCD4356]NNV10856.1 serine/threonine protein phosphatase [Roseobacter sp. HKCCD7357]NNV15041.1 serine/threonine protein phosphatase [Roseobacter sp. HKCCD8768]NNV24500.1 serine/threonine protein phosphatase [Roseobacter sp. HKCCD8192]NNV28757.1 serine/threonine protein phosphatase [Roseobacter sp. HKCCD9061]
MKGRLSSLLGRSTDTPAAPESRDPGRPTPGRPVYIVGDLHGRADLLEHMLELIDAHIGETKAQDPHLVFVGDYVDNGPDSGTVLERLHELTSELPDNVTCLMGNHDRMMLDFLADPVIRGPRWFRAGAAATLASLGLPVEDIPRHPGPETLIELAALLKSNLTAERHSWLAALPLSWSAGNLWVVHAAADPQHRMEDQNPRTLLWGHPEFESRPRTDDIWIAHGHAQVTEPLFAQGRIAMDTGAWHSGHLTACALSPDGDHIFLQT